MSAAAKLDAAGPRGWWRPADARRRRRGRIAVIATALVTIMAVETFRADYRFVVDGQETRCLEGWLFLVDLTDGMAERGGYLAFAPPPAMAAHDDRDLSALKRLAGLPGDTVVVGRDVTTVNGTVVGRGLALTNTLGTTPEAYERRFVVPEGHVFMMGDTLDSFDGRYWGTVPYERIIGEGYWLL